METSHTSHSTLDPPINTPAITIKKRSWKDEENREKKGTENYLYSVSGGEREELPEGMSAALVCLESLTKYHISSPQHLIHEVDQRLRGIDAYKNLPSSLH